MRNGKQVGRVDDKLLARVDAEAKRRGQTRKVFIERALLVALGEGKPHRVANRCPACIDGIDGDVVCTEAAGCVRLVPVDRASAFRTATQR